MCFKEHRTILYIILSQILFSNRGDKMLFDFFFYKQHIHCQKFSVTFVEAQGAPRGAEWSCLDPRMMESVRCMMWALWSAMTVTRTGSSLVPGSESVWRMGGGQMAFQYAVSFTDLFSLYWSSILQSCPCPTTNLHCIQTQIQSLDLNWLLMEVGDQIELEFNEMEI